MLGRRGKVDPGRHPVWAAPEAAENRFGACQEQEIQTFPKWNVRCRCWMPGASRTPVKVRRRAAARNLLRSPDAAPKQKRHLVDGVWVDKLPFSARDAWLAEQAEKARFKAEVEAWEAKEAESPRRAWTGSGSQERMQEQPPNRFVTLARLVSQSVPGFGQRLI